jgi:hypothetical protein
MSTLAQITAAIDDDIRNKTPLVLKVEHADVEQLITDEMFPDSAKLEWSGSAVVDPIADIVVNPSLSTLAKIEFKIYFEKIGNQVFGNGIIRSKENSIDIGTVLLATFPTNTYKPLTTHSTRVPLIMDNNASPAMLPNGFLYIGVAGVSQGLFFTGTFPVSNNRYFNLSFHYKVAN